MNSISSLHPLAKAWLLDGPLAAHLDAYTALLERGNYAAHTMQTNFRALAHFAHWMSRCRVTAEQLDQDCVSQFLDFHLPNCDCHSIALRTHDDLRAALGHLLAVLRDQRVIAQLVLPTGPIADELSRYDKHMRDARGPAEGTRKGRLHMVGQFLRWTFADHEFTGKEMLMEDLRGFITKELERINTTSYAKCLAASFRAYFRYRLTCGDEVRGLMGVISTPAQWTLASLPRALTTQEVQRLMAHCEQALPSPFRILSMVRLALDLGLRSAEIAQLELGRDCLGHGWRGRPGCDGRHTSGKPGGDLTSKLAKSQKGPQCVGCSLNGWGRHALGLMSNERDGVTRAKITEAYLCLSETPDQELSSHPGVDVDGGSRQSLVALQVLCEDGADAINSCCAWTNCGAKTLLTQEEQ